MPEFPAQSLAQWTGGRWTAQPVPPLSGFCVDSRQLRAGEVFVALKTDRRDGHDFLGDAAAAGAGAAIVAHANPGVTLPQLVVTDPLQAFQAIAREHRRTFRGRVVGISGSAGKTSTKDLLALLLGGGTCGVSATGEHDSEAPFTPRVLATEGNLNKASFESEAPFTPRVLATEGNLNNHIGVPLTLTRLDSDRHDIAVVEAGISAPGEMRVLADMIVPDVALITLVAPAHTEDLGGMDGVAREKAVLPAATRPMGVAVFSSETAAFPAFRELRVRTLIVERAEQLPASAPDRNRVSFTLDQQADGTAVSIAYGAPPPLRFMFRRVSDGMAQNAVLAICAALWLGVDAPTIQSRLARWRPARLRGEIRRESGRLLYLDCYNANPASMADALRTFDAIAPASEPRLYIIGSMEELGAQAPAYHQRLGASLVVREADQVYFIGAHARTMCDAARAAGRPVESLHAVATVDELGDLALTWRGAVFVKGSRRYELEKVLGPPARAGAAAH